MNKKDVLLTTVLSVALVPVTASMAEAALMAVTTMDDFTVTQQVSKMGPGALTPSTLNISSPLFGATTQRRITGSLTGGTGTVTVDVNQSFLGGFSTANGPGVSSRITTTYSTPPSNTVINPPVDFTQGTADRILLDILFNDFTMDVVLNVRDNDGTNGKFTLTTPGSIFSPTLYSALYSGFTATGGTTAGIDFTQIRRFSFETNSVSGVPAADISFGLVATAKEIPDPPQDTPEPTTMLGLLAVAGAASAFRKKNAQAK